MALPTPATPVAKSLHTLTVIQQVTRVFLAAGTYGDTETAMLAAMDALGLAGRPDPYGLRARALELMTRDQGAKKAPAKQS